MLVDTAVSLDVVMAVAVDAGTVIYVVVSVEAIVPVYAVLVLNALLSVAKTFISLVVAVPLRTSRIEYCRGSRCCNVVCLWSSIRCGVNRYGSSNGNRLCSRIRFHNDGRFFSII